jgi:GTP cyclohydrolase I
MEDIQTSVPNHPIAIDQVGVKDIRYPVILRTKNGGTLNTVARVSLYVHLPSGFKGTHMSRFVEILSEYHEHIDPRNMKDILERMLDRLSAKKAFIRIEAPFFQEKPAPVSGKVGMMDYECIFAGYRDSFESSQTTLEVEVPVTFVCPCSKAISDRGAHNQRGTVSVKIKTSPVMIWVEDIIELVESASSCDLFSVLKREDEKFVTERAYDNPMFVEDAAREVAHQLSLKTIEPYVVSVSTQESIHNHAAYARISKGMFA